jgi:hypothetical protein
VANALQNGTALRMAPHQVVETTLAAVAYEGEGVVGITRAGVVQQ